MNDKKTLYKLLKQKFSKEIYKIRKQIYLLYGNESFSTIEYLCEIADNELTSKSEKLLFMECCKKNEKISVDILRSGIPFTKDNLNYFFKTYNAKFLASYFNIFLEIEGYSNDSIRNYGSLKVFVPYLNNYYDNFITLVNNDALREIAVYLVNEKAVKPSIVIKNTNHLNKLYKLDGFKDLQNECYEKLLTIDDEIINQIYNIIYDIQYYREANDDSLDAIKYLLSNPTIENINNYHLMCEERKIEQKQKSDIKSVLVYNHNYEWAMNYLDYIIETSIDLNQIKISFEELIFGIFNGNDIKHIKQISEYHIEDLPVDVIEYLNMYEDFSKCQNQEDYINFLETIKNNGKIYHKSIIDNEIIKKYHEEVNSKLFNPNNLVENENVVIEYKDVELELNGQIVKKKVKIIKIKNIPFTCLSTSIGSKKSHHGAISDEQADFTEKLVDNPDAWLSNPETGVNFISMSANSSDRFRSFVLNNMIIAGFSQVNNGQIRYTHTADAGTNMSPRTTIVNYTDLHSIDKLTQYSTKTSFGSEDTYNNQNGYNEVVSNRAGIIPDYFITASWSNIRHIPMSSDKRSLYWAAFYDKPIVEIDCESYFKTGLEKFNEYFSMLKTSPSVPTIQELKKLEILKCKMENFYPGYFIDYYDMIMGVIDMNNREWNLENIERLQIIFNNTFDLNNGQNITFYKSKVIPPSEVNDKLSYKRKLEQDRLENINRFRNQIKNELMVLSKGDNDSVDVEEFKEKTF